MSENESGIKRATEDEQPQSPKKFKLDGEESTTISPVSIDNKKEEINKTETPVTVAGNLHHRFSFIIYELANLQYYSL